jgi:hypothetical protein
MFRPIWESLRFTLLPTRSSIALPLGRSGIASPGALGSEGLCVSHVANLSERLVMMIAIQELLV